jgi:YVTN family beta-propeller protein
MTKRYRLIAFVVLAISAGGCSNPTDKSDGGENAVRLEFAAGDYTLKQGVGTNIRARAYDANGDEIAGVNIHYAVSTGVATMSNNGVATGRKGGYGTVTASLNGLQASTDLEVFGHPDGTFAFNTPVGDRPFGLAVSVDGLVYVTRLDGAKITALDTTGAVVDSVNVESTPTGVTFSPDGQTAYVTNQLSQSLGVISVATSAQVDTVTLPASPFVPFVSPDGSKVFVTSNTSNVWLVNAATGAVTDSIVLTHAPNGFALHPDLERVYISTFVGGTVSEVSIATGQVLRTFTPGGTPQAVIVSPDGNELYVANEAGFVEFYDLATGNSVGKATLTGGAFGMALSPDLATLFVTEPGNGLVELVNTATREKIKTTDVGGTPRRIAFTHHGNFAAVANEGGYVTFLR